MGSRGQSLGKSRTATQAYHKKSYEKEFTPNTRGQITKYEAGIAYKASKNGDIEALPEFTKMLYNEADAPYRTASQRYAQYTQYYDKVQYMTTALINNDYKVAQAFVNEIQADMIRNAGRKGNWYKYQAETGITYDDDLDDAVKKLKKYKKG